MRKQEKKDSFTGLFTETDFSVLCATGTYSKRRLYGRSFKKGKPKGYGKKGERSRPGFRQRSKGKGYAAWDNDQQDTAFWGKGKGRKGKKGMKGKDSFKGMGKGKGDGKNKGGRQFQHFRIRTPPSEARRRDRWQEKDSRIPASSPRSRRNLPGETGHRPSVAQGQLPLCAVASAEINPPLEDHKHLHRPEHQFLLVDWSTEVRDSTREEDQKLHRRRLLPWSTLDQYGSSATALSRATAISTASSKLRLPG